MKQKQKKNKVFKFFVVIFIAIILIFSKHENQEKFVNFIKASKLWTKELKVDNSISVDIDIEQSAFYDGTVILWGDNKLRSLELDGNVKWQKQFNLDQPIVYFGKEKIYIYERPVGHIYTLNPKGETLEKVQLNLPIYNFKENLDSILVHVKKDNKESLKILDGKGILIGEKTVENNNILIYDVNKNNKNYALATLNLEGNNLKSEIHMYGIDGKLLYTTYLDNQIVMYLKIYDKNNLIALSDKAIYQIDNGDVLWEKQFQLIKDIHLSKKNIYILHGNTLEAISFDGRTIEKESFTDEYKKIIPHDKYIILYGENNIIGLKEGKEIFKYKSEKAIINVIQGKGKLIVVYKDKINIISL